jgi:hypothetical protein
VSGAGRREKAGRGAKIDLVEMRQIVAATLGFPGVSAAPSSTDVAPASPPASDLRGFSRVLLVAAGVWQAFAALQPSRYAVQWLTHDDTYLALQVAWNWARVGWPTFDGLHRTNGFQALWGLVLAGLSSLAPTREWLISFALLAAAVCNLVGGLLLMRWLERRVGGVAGVFGAAGWAAFMASGHPSLIGLENALCGLAIVLLTIVADAVVRQPGSLAAWAAFGACAGGLAWVRLDGIVPAGVCGLCAVLISGRRVAVGPLLAGVGVAGALLAGLIAFNQWAGNTPTPVSGMVKRHIARQIEPAWDGKTLAAAGADTVRQMAQTAPVAFGVGWPRSLDSLARMTIPPLILLAVYFGRASIPPALGLLLIAAAAHVFALRLWLSGYFSGAPWYFSPQQVAWIALAAWAVTRLQEPARGRFTRGIAAFAVIKIAAAGTTFWAPPPRGPDSVAGTRMAAAAWLREHVPAENRVAAWNAGELAYFSGRTVINLDGLVNDRAYYESLVAGRPTGEYLDEQGVTWLADYPENVEPWLERGWVEVARFGNVPATAQVIARRAEYPASSNVR